MAENQKEEITSIEPPLKGLAKSRACLRHWTPEEAREMQKKALEAKKRNKEEREQNELLFKEIFKRGLMKSAPKKYRAKLCKDFGISEEASTKIIIAMKRIEQALRGDRNAFLDIQASIGEQPVIKEEVTNINKEPFEVKIVE